MRSSRRRIGVATSYAATTGYVSLRRRRSPLRPLPVSCGSPHVPSQSSRTWKARPSSRPAASNRCATARGAPASTAPAAIAAPRSAPVFIVDQPEVGRLGGAGTALQREIEALTLDHLNDCRAEHVGGAHSASGPWSRREQACQAAANMPSPALMPCSMPQIVHTVGAMAAQLVAVLDVVVDEREVVDQLDCDRCRECPVRVTAERLARPERQRRADPLTRRVVRRVSMTRR